MLNLKNTLKIEKNTEFEDFEKRIEISVQI